YFVAWTADSKRLYIPTQLPDAVSLVDVTQANKELAFRDLNGACEKPHVVALNADKALFVVCEGDQVGPGDVLMLDPVSLSTSASTKVGVYPDAFVRVGGG